MHPLMPFITEELWQRVPRPPSRKASVAFGPYPTADAEKASLDATVEAWMTTLQEVFSAARTVRSEHGVQNKADVPMRVRTGDAETAAFLRGHAESIRLLVKTQGEPVVEAPGGAREAGTTVSVVPTTRGSIEVLVGLKGLVTKDEEIARIDREKKRIEKDLGALEKKLGSPGFVDRAPPDVVDEAKQQRDAFVEARGRLEEARRLAEEL